MDREPTIADLGLTREDVRRMTPAQRWGLLAQLVRLAYGDQADRPQLPRSQWPVIRRKLGDPEE